MKTKLQYPIFKKSIAGVITILILGSFILIRGTKDKTEFHQLTGKVVFLDKTFEELPLRHLGKYRYLLIDNYSNVFEIFVGKDFGDFKPLLERIDDLKVGDEIVVHFDEDSKEKINRLNRLIQYIDKDGKPYFIRGNKDKNGGYFFIGLSIILGAFIIYLKEIGKII
ncbi:MAG TPA: hypothetical protein VGK10_07775 [Prolixibacteraceae bacterium]